MSGIEVTGFVLGSLPLLISGLEHYADGVRTLKGMWNYAAEVDMFASEFELLEGIFRNSCKEFLMPVLTEGEATRFDQKGFLQWDDQSFQAKVRLQLGEEQAIRWIRAVKMLSRRIDRFSAGLQLDKNSRLPPWVDKERAVDMKVRKKFFKETWYRIRVGFEQEQFHDLLDKIDKNVNQIKLFTEGTMDLNVKYADVKKATFPKRWLVQRLHTKSLFDTIRSSWACKCPGPHRASLRLNECLVTDILADSSKDSEDAFQFDVLFSLTSDASQTAGSTWQWCSLSILVFSKEEQGTLQVPSSPKMGGNIIKKARFSPEPAQAMKSCSPHSTDFKIASLCKTLQDTYPTTECLGYLEDCEGRLELFPSKSATAAAEVDQLVTFHELLKSRGRRGLATREKYQLALIVACAVLQLHSGPWLEERWGLNDVHFARPSGSRPSIAHPYVTRSFEPSTLLQSRSNTAANSISRVSNVCVANEAIFALGVALIEISFGVPILDLKEPTDPDFPAQPGLSEFFIANRLVKEDAIKENDHDKYAEVVWRCIAGRLNTESRNIDLDDAKVRQTFYESIVVPLREANDSLNS